MTTSHNMLERFQLDLGDMTSTKQTTTIMEGNQRKFHFVNKTSLSISLSSSQGRARFEIFRHAKLKPSIHKSAQLTTPAPRGRNVNDVQTQPIVSEEDWEDLPTKGMSTFKIGLRQRGQRGCIFTKSSQSLSSAHAPALTYLEGSSDPFAAQSIVITPKINQLIAFIRDSYIPALYVTPFMRTFSQECPKYTTIENISTALGGTEAMKNWNHLRRTLSSDGGASAWVASWIPCILPFVDKSELREWCLTGLKMRAHSIQILRERLSTGSVTHQLGLPVLLHIMYLFRADCVMGDTQAATIHARMLRPLIEEMEDPYQQAELLVIVLYNDQEMQMAKLQRTLFDPISWVPDRLTDFWRKTELLLPDVGEAYYKNLHGSINTMIVREAAIHLRRCLLIGRTPMRLRDPLTLKLGQSIYNWMATITLCDMGALLAIHLDLIEDTDSLLSIGKRYTEAALAIAMLQILRKSMHSMTVDNIADRRDYSHVIVPKLRSTLEKAQEVSTAEEQLYYGDAYLWMFYIGTHYEQRLRKHSDIVRSSESEEQWFSGRFIEQSRLLGFRSWSEVEKVLKLFVVNPYLYLGQSLETWFHDMIDRFEDV